MDEILTEQRGPLGLITLNRPQALNALTPGMVRAMDAQLRLWAADPAIKTVAVQGAGGKAFCSGGDVKSVALDIKAAGKLTPLARDFFREEYTLNHLIHTFPKPYIALIDGIVMGGGKGISAHGSYRIVSPAVTFAMPETNIGFFPDVGGGHFLPRCPGQTGLYLALTSRRVGLADCLYMGFATHALASADFPALLDALAKGAMPDTALAAFTAPPAGESFLAANRDAIDRCFSADTIEGIRAALAAENTDFSRETLAALAGMCPLSLAVALKQVREGVEMDFAAVMRMEYRISQRMVVEPDFIEGIRAALIDKDRTPKWSPAPVTPARLAAIFAPLGEGELILSS